MKSFVKSSNYSQWMKIDIKARKNWRRAISIRFSSKDASATRMHTMILTTELPPSSKYRTVLPPIMLLWNYSWNSHCQFITSRNVRGATFRVAFIKPGPGTECTIQDGYFKTVNCRMWETGWLFQNCKIYKKKNAVRKTILIVQIMNYV